MDAGAKIKVFDPEAMENVKKIYGERIHFGLDQYDVLSGADALMIMTEWNEFRSPDFNVIKNRLADRLILDGRNLYDPSMISDFGMDYFSIGRPSE